jgi:hypothetical protein
MECLDLDCQGIVASYLEIPELTTFNMLDLLTEKDWKYNIIYYYASIINDTEDKGGFQTWREFYYHVDRLINSKATMLEFKSAQLSVLNLKAVKDTIPFNELGKFFLPNIAATLASLKEGDVIKLIEEGDFLVVEKENTTLVLKYKTQYDSDVLGLRNVRIHDFSLIYNFPPRYWDKEGFEPFNLFSLSLRPEVTIKLITGNMLFLVHRNITYVLIFKYISNLENFTRHEMAVRFRPAQRNNTGDLNYTTLVEAS